MMWHEGIWRAGMCVVAGYLCGAVPFGLLVGKIKGVDVRRLGSGNIGATNVGRVLGRGYGVLVFVLDGLKSWVPVTLVGHWLTGAAASAGGDACATATGQAVGMSAGGHLVWMAVAAACILGHVFPVWLGFKGGKGVATSLGALLGVYPFFLAPALIALGLWIVVTLVTRYVSAASMLAAITFPIVFAMAAHLQRRTWGTFEQLWPMHAFGIAIALLVIYRHRSNLQRLLAGTESKIGSSHRST